MLTPKRGGLVADAVPVVVPAEDGGEKLAADLARPQNGLGKIKVSLEELQELSGKIVLKFDCDVD